MSIEVKPDVDLEAMMDAEIPCGGWHVNINDPLNTCDSGAQLHSRMHGCGVRFKCIRCWQAWYLGCSAALARKGYVQCWRCKRRFSTIEAFSDYGPF